MGWVRRKGFDGLSSVLPTLTEKTIFIYVLHGRTASIKRAVRGQHITAGLFFTSFYPPRMSFFTLFYIPFWFFIIIKALAEKAIPHVYQEQAFYGTTKHEHGQKKNVYIAKRSVYLVFTVYYI